MEAFRDLRTLEEERAIYSSKYHYSGETQKWSEFQDIVENRFDYLYNWLDTVDSKSSTKVMGNRFYYLNRAKTFIKKIEETRTDDTIHLYRALGLVHPDSLNKEDLGICWTWDNERLDYLSMMLIDSKLEYEVRLHITTSLDNIDWFESFYLFCVYGNNEKELRLIDPEKVRLVGYLLLSGRDSKTVLKKWGASRSLLPMKDREATDLVSWKKIHLKNIAGKVDVKGSVQVKDWMVEDGHLLVNFGKVGRNCRIRKIGLTTLKGCPDYVGGDFDCSLNPITSLEGSPKQVEGLFNCGNTNIKDLKGIPEKASYYGITSCPHLESLEGAPEDVQGDFNISLCKSLQSLKGAPNRIGGDFTFTDCKGLKSLDDAPEYVKGNVTFFSIDHYADEYKGEVEGRINAKTRRGTTIGGEK